MESVHKLLPSRGRIGYDPLLFFFGQRMHRGRQGAKRFLHAFIRRREFEPCVKGFEVPTELVSKYKERFRLDRVGIRHGYL